MCGIVAYVGEREALPILLAGLQRLEYRGYDSAGIALVPESIDGQAAPAEGERRLLVRKRAGRLRGLRELVEQTVTTTPGVWYGTGIGHTRWATHGPPTDANAHPHTDCTGQIAVVHNGILENAVRLREELAARGHRFLSETDTEVVAHLLEEELAASGGQITKKAWLAILQKLEGSFAIAAVDARQPGRIWLARYSSPLIVAPGADGWLAASDIPALLPYTRKVFICGDREAVCLQRREASFFTFRGEPIQKVVHQIGWRAEQAEKRGYTDFMIKEIHEEPAIVERLSERYAPAGQVELPLMWPPSWWEQRRQGWLIASGTAAHAGWVAKRWLERIAGLPLEADVASEFRYRDPLFRPEDWALVISQSGETADTLAGLRYCRQHGVPTLALVNVVGSSIAREADQVVYTDAGPEIAVASTKAYTAQLVVLYLLTSYVAKVRGRGQASAEGLAALPRLPEQLADVLAREQELERVAQQLAEVEHVFYIGRGVDQALAAEGALKLKEISYIHAEAYAAGELKHGPLALIGRGTPVIAVLTEPDLVVKTLGNVQEVKARGAWVAAIGMEEYQSQARAAGVDTWFGLPELPRDLRPMLAATPLQLLAYHVARLRGSDVDRPRNLAKSVTVE